MKKRLIITLLVIVALAIPYVKYVRKAHAACDPLATPTFTARGNFTRCFTNQCAWNACLQTFIDEVSTRTMLLGEALLPGTFFDKGNQVYDIQAYGAKADYPTTDNTSFIQAAATACAATHGTIFIPQGDYKITDTITFTDCQVKGAGTGGSRFIATSALAGKPMVINTDSIHNGAIRPTQLQDFALFCGVTSPTHGLHPTNLIDGLRLDTPSELTNIRVSNCDKGIVTNSVQGHQTFFRVQSINNYYGVYFNKQAPSNHDGGAFAAYDSAFTGSSFAGMGIPGDGYLTDAHFTRVIFGFSPYGIWQEANASGNGFITATIFDDCEFEAIGNAAIFSKNIGVGNGGQVNNVNFRFVGYTDSSTDPTINLNPSGNCTGSGTNYQCCTGSGTGCAKTYAVVAGTCYVWDVLSGLHGFATPSGGTGAVNCAACQGRMNFTGDVASPPVITCGSNPSFVHILDGNGQSDNIGIKPATTCTTCSSLNYGALCVDSDVNELCYCNGAVTNQNKWCQVRQGTSACGTATSCN